MSAPASSDATTSMKAGKFGILSAILSSACCIGPMLLVAMGLGGGAAFFGRYHWFFLLGGLAVLSWAWARYLREKTACDCEHRAMNARRASFFTLLFATGIVALFSTLNVSRYVFRGAQRTAPQTIVVEATTAGLQRAVIPVEGMRCATCEIAVRSALSRVPGVKSARASVASKTATVDFDHAQTRVEQLVSAINSTGYHVSLPQK